MHGRPLPLFPGKASLLLVCAHRWEAEPFLRRAGLRDVAQVPFAVYAGTYREVDIELTVCGNGYSRAIMATTAWLATRLQSAQRGLLAPPVVVANFGTAGAYPNTWQIGQTLVVSKLSRPGGSGALFPERLISWDSGESECRTVERRQTEHEPEDRLRDRRPVFDMEAYGVAEAAMTFLSSASLVVGKCVLDLIADDGDLRRELSALQTRVAEAYAAGAERFLEHAIEHQQSLQHDARRLLTQSLNEEVGELLRLSRSFVHLTVSQQRALDQSLRAVLAADPHSTQRIRQLLEAHLEPTQGGTKEQTKAVIASLLEKLATTL